MQTSTEPGTLTGRRSTRGSERNGSGLSALLCAALKHLLVLTEVAPVMQSCTDTLSITTWGPRGSLSLSCPYMLGTTAQGRPPEARRSRREVPCLRDAKQHRAGLSARKRKAKVSGISAVSCPTSGCLALHTPQHTVSPTGTCRTQLNSSGWAHRLATQANHMLLTDLSSNMQVQQEL